MQQNIKWVFFDLDNTLIKTRSAAKKADSKVFSYLARKTGLSTKEIRSLWLDIVNKVKKSRNPKKRDRSYSYKVLAEMLNVQNEYKRLLEIFEKEMLKELKLYRKDIKHVLRKLKKNYRLGIITASLRMSAIKKMKKAGIYEFFDIIITADDTQTMKPSRKYYDLILKKTGARKSEVLIVSTDYKDDIMPAKNFGFRAMHLSHLTRRLKSKGKFRKTKNWELDLI